MTDLDRADYDWRAFGRLLRERLASDGRGYRAIADAIGVTFTDLSRASSGNQPMTAGKVIALCDYLNVSFRAFYLRPGVGRDGAYPMKSDCCSGINVKHRACETESEAKP